MRFVALLLLVPLALGIGTACTYDWTYSEPGNPKEKDGGGIEEEEDSASPTGNECSTKEPTCAKGVCVFADGQCGKATSIGKCLEPECENVEVCTCDGQRMNGCEAAKAFKSIDKSGDSCPPLVKEYFDCYGIMCVVNVQYCQSKAGTSGQCVDYTTNCVRDCLKCAGELPPAPCSCNTDAKGNLIIKC